jgi:hypothetical protein
MSRIQRPLVQRVMVGRVGHAPRAPNHLEEAKEASRMAAIMEHALGKWNSGIHKEESNFSDYSY